MTLGGRVSEEIFFGPENITTGAQDDLQKITRMAFEACANYGMNSIIGPVSYGGREGQKESWTKPFSEKTGEMLDAEVRKMITCLVLFLFVFSNVLMGSISSSAHQRTTELLTHHREAVEKVAQLLLEKEVITRCVTRSPTMRAFFYYQPDSEDMINLLGKRPFVGKADDMDKWLDQNRGSERSAPPPLEEAPSGPAEPTPAPVTVSTSLKDYKW